MKIRLFAFVCYILVTIGLMPITARAATVTWAGPSSGSWSTAANWLGGVVPASGDDAVFPSLGGFRSVNLGGSQAINSVQFNSASPNGYLLYAGSLGISSFVDQAGSADGSFSASVAFGSAITLSGAGSGNVYFQGGVSGSPFISMVGGNYWLAGANAFTPAALTITGGYLHLIGTNHMTVSGNVQISGGGTMCVQGFFPSTVSAAGWNVMSGGTLKVSGPISGPVYVTGGTFAAGCSPGSAYVLGDLSFDPSSHTEFELATPNVVANGNDWISVGGDLTLDGALDIVALPGFGPGTYRLFNYTNFMFDNGVHLGSVPSGYTCQLDLSTPNQVNLLVATAAPQTYDVAIHAGLNLIANQLDHGSNTLNEIMPAVPNGCVLYKYQNASGTWREASFFDVWPDNLAAFTLSPGEGAFLQSPTSFTLTFTGTPHVPVLPVSIPAGATYLLSRQTNDIGTYENITGTSPADGATVYTWNGVGYDMDQYYGGFGWASGADPMVAVGGAIWISATGSGTPSGSSVICPTNKTVECGSAWTFDEPTVIGPCGGTNANITVLTIVTNGTGCSQTITCTWQVSDTCGGSAQCSQTVTVVDTTPPAMTFTSFTVSCDDVWVIPAATAYDACCGTNVTLSLLSAVTNGGPCPNDMSVEQVWQATDCCSNSVTSTQVVTVVAANIVTVPEGGSVTLTPPVLVEGATFQWYSNGTNLP